MNRLDGRLHNEIRPIKILHNVCGNADGSVLFELGNTKVLCSVIIQDGVPHFLKGKGQGWLTAEYTMLPASTRVRTVREISSMKRNGRSVEISRLIGRSLRAIVDFKALGERTLYVDCDVVQADGGTRTAAINGAYCALLQAMHKLIDEKKLTSFLTDSLAAVSVGLLQQTPLLDINFQEDSAVQADFNFVMTGKGDVIEVQGSTEKLPISWNAVLEMRALALIGVQEILKNIASFEQPPAHQSFVKEIIQSVNSRFSSF